MKLVRVITMIAALLQMAGCAMLAGDWPDRANKSPEEMLTDLIRWQQRAEVRVSTGEWAHECFTDLDFDAFVRAKRAKQVVGRLQKAPDFGDIAAALRTLAAEKRKHVLAEARLIARPTWQVMGFVDRAGRGQTEAGHQAEVMIAAALVDAFAAAVDANQTTEPPARP